MPLNQRANASCAFNSPLSVCGVRRTAAENPAVHLPFSGVEPAARRWKSLWVHMALAAALLSGGSGFCGACAAGRQPQSAHAASHTACPGFALLGVNLAGAEFNPTQVPGKAGQDFTYPSAAEIAYFAAQGLNLIRLPLLWERLQHREFGPLDPAAMRSVQTVIREAAGHGMTVDLDLHNYGSGFGHPVGSRATPDRAFADLWRRVARRFRSDSNVMFGLMNEPHVQTAAEWVAAANAAIAAIRTAGAKQEILVSGIDWDGAWHWISSGTAAAMQAGLRPEGNVVFEVHQYLDSDGSGTHWNVVSPSIGVQRLRTVTQWAERNGEKLFLGEFGSAADAPSLTALDNMLGYMCAHTTAWQGGAYWSGGAWWHTYPFSIEPEGGRSRPQMRILARYAPGTLQTARKRDAAEQKEK